MLLCLKKLRIEPVTPDFHGKWFIHYTKVAPFWQFKKLCANRFNG